jgi:hypothetical protein
MLRHSVLMTAVSLQKFRSLCTATHPSMIASEPSMEESLKQKPHLNAPSHIQCRLNGKATCAVVTTVRYAVVRHAVDTMLWRAMLQCAMLWCAMLWCAVVQCTLLDQHPNCTMALQAPPHTPSSQPPIHTPVHSSALIAPGPGVVEPSGHGVHPLGAAGPGPGPGAGLLSGSNTPLSAAKVPTGQLLLAAACRRRLPVGLGGPPIGIKEAPGIDWGPGPGGFEVEDGVVLLVLGFRTALAAACAALTASSSSRMQVRQVKPRSALQAAGTQHGTARHSCQTLMRCDISEQMPSQHYEAHDL